jgi:hypothetical protein
LSEDSRLTRRLLWVVIVAAAALRFTALDWGLRHPPHIDEEPFVEHSLAMLGRGDLDHTYYEYPGLIFYLLAVPLAFFRSGGPSAYMAARATIALFSLLNVVLIYHLGSLLKGPRAGLVAAALLAVSPAEIRVAHMIRPDIVLETFALLALVSFHHVGERARSDLLAGAALGAAVAVKFTGVLLVPCYLVQRFLAPGFRWSRPLLAAAASLAAFALLSPYSFLHFRDAARGAWYQAAWHYPSGAASGGDLQALRGYGLAADWALGASGLALVALGLALWRREWRRWLFLMIYPLATVVILSTADIQRLRFMVPALGALAVIAGAAVDVLAARSAVLGAAAALLVVGLSGADSAAYVARLEQASPRDLALDWVNTHLPVGSRILTTWPGRIGLDEARYSVIAADRLDASSWRQAIEADALVCGPSFEDPGLLQRLSTVYTTRRVGRELGARLEVLTPPEGVRPRYRRLSLTGVRLHASHNEGQLDRLRDGDPGVPWDTGPDPVLLPRLELELPEPEDVARIELVHCGSLPAAETIRVWVSRNGRTWRHVHAARGWPLPTPGADEHSQVLLVEAPHTRFLRLVRMGRVPRPWTIGELHLDSME